MQSSEQLKNQNLKFQIASNANHMRLWRPRHSLSKQKYRLPYCWFPFSHSMHLRLSSVLPPIYLRYTFDTSSIVLRFPNDSRTKPERRMNEGWTKDERESIEERTRTERRAIEKQSRTDRRIKRSITLHYRLVCWITISFHCLDFLGATVYFSILFTKK